MAVPRKLIAMPNAATRELWRIAESGAIDELEDVLPQANINGRNEHGMTALMRAARHGRLQMVRLLLENGADPNLTRNDNFTALSLAAFFGHGEIVDLLMRHGANAEVATRFETSPYIWAKARSFGDVARCLENPSVLEKSEMPEQREVEALPISAPPPESPIVVRTLKDPPEIWDLVHEAPRNFNPRSAFMTRLGLSRGGSALLTLSLLVVAGGAITAWVFFKDRISLPNVPAAAATTKAPPATTTTKTAPTVPASAATQPTIDQPASETNSAVPETTVTTTEPPAVPVDTNYGRRSRAFARSRAISSDVNNASADTSPTSVPPSSAAPPKADPQANKDNAEPKKTNTPASSQVISQPKSSPPPQQPKPKVIQWP